MLRLNPRRRAPLALVVALAASTLGSSLAVAMPQHSAPTSGTPGGFTRTWGSISQYTATASLFELELRMICESCESGIASAHRTTFNRRMNHVTHTDHAHAHGAADCSHQRVQHAEHVDYLHDGHLHFIHDGHIDEHTLEVSSANPADCTSSHACGGHDEQHRHGTGCGHEAVPHAEHTDYLVAGHLHSSHESHCDDHGALTLA